MAGMDNFHSPKPFIKGPKTLAWEARNGGREAERGLAWLLENQEEGFKLHSSYEETDVMNTYLSLS